MHSPPLINRLVSGREEYGHSHQHSEGIRSSIEFPATSHTKSDDGPHKSDVHEATGFLFGIQSVGEKGCE